MKRGSMSEASQLARLAKSRRICDPRLNTFTKHCSTLQTGTPCCPAAIRCVIVLHCCDFHCVCSPLQGFPVLQQRGPAVRHPLHGLRPLSGPQDSALPLWGGAAVAGGFVQQSASQHALVQDGWVWSRRGERLCVGDQNLLSPLLFNMEQLEVHSLPRCCIFSDPCFFHAVVPPAVYPWISWSDK